MLTIFLVSILLVSVILIAYLIYKKCIKLSGRVIKITGKVYKYTRPYVDKYDNFINSQEVFDAYNKENNELSTENFIKTPLNLEPVEECNAKNVWFGNDARDKISLGVDILANAVGATLGPKGRNVVIDRKGDQFLVTKDGVTVARNIDLSYDKHINLGAKLVKEVAGKTNEIAGDGTTTATVFARAIYKEGLEYIKNGSNPMQLKREMEDAVNLTVKFISEYAHKINTKQDLYNVAYVSSNADKELAEIISSAMEAVNRQGTIAVEDSRDGKTKLKLVEGMQIERGLIVREFANNKSKIICEYDNPLILIADYKLDSVPQLAPIIRLCQQENKPLIIFAEEFDDILLTFLLKNTTTGIIKVCPILSPGFGDWQRDYITDIAALVGANIVSKDYGVRLESCSISDLGSCEKIIVGHNDSIIIKGKGNASERIETLREQVESLKEVGGLELDKIKDRLNRLTNAIAIIQVGALSETEMKDKKLRIEDALNATRAAVEEGTVPGGGKIFLLAHNNLPSQTDGQKVIRKALLSSIETMCFNGGLDKDIVIPLIDSRDNLGYNFSNDSVVDMFMAGIIDPAKVSRSALQHAASVAGMMLTTECVVLYPEVEKK